MFFSLSNSKFQAPVTITNIFSLKYWTKVAVAVFSSATKEKKSSKSGLVDLLVVRSKLPES